MNKISGLVLPRIPVPGETKVLRNIELVFQEPAPLPYVEDSWQLVHFSVVWVVKQMINQCRGHSMNEKYHKPESWSWSVPSTLVVNSMLPPGQVGNQVGWAMFPNSLGSLEYTYFGSVKNINLKVSMLF